MKKRGTMRLAPLMAGVLLLAACSNTGASLSPGATPSAPASSASDAGSPSAPASATTHDLSQVPPAPDFSGAITADGATFPQPVYEQWLQSYNRDYPQIKVSYAGGGSGQGIKDITANTVQFAGSDAPMKADEKQAAESRNGTPILHIPALFGAIVVAYNLPGVEKLNFSPDVIGKVFTGKITNWNDPVIKADNPNASLPDQQITVVHRSDGSGTTNAFTSWLCEVSSDWKDTLGANSCAGKEVKWPVGLGGKGNPGVTAQVTQTAGAIGYIELAYALQNKVPYGNVKNASGSFVEPTLDSVAAAANFEQIPADLTFEAWGSSVADAYPITTATWLLVYQQQEKVSSDQARSAAVVHVLIWALDKGGDDAKSLSYAVLPDRLREAALARIATITWNGTPMVDELYR
ncbi:MAG TPA: phosphate ABC transporter substrate-binding protein PstS [Candidatus Limnocylindria bacterium]|nr:phosphate ABC transporter substrate-binding protein PstS [Candidatus Limnocylindria bacterium]